MPTPLFCPLVSLLPWLYPPPHTFSLQLVLTFLFIAHRVLATSSPPSDDFLPSPPTNLLHSLTPKTSSLPPTHLHLNPDMDSDFVSSPDMDVDFVMEPEKIHDFFPDNGINDDFVEDQGLVSHEVPVMVDSSKHFKTYQEFASSEHLLEWARRIGRNNGIVVVVTRSDVKNPSRAPRIMLGCERSGQYKARKNRNQTGKKRKTSTKKYDCPFSMKAYLTDPLNKRWGLVVVNGNHNHALVKAFEGYS